MATNPLQRLPTHDGSAPDRIPHLLRSTREQDIECLADAAGFPESPIMLRPSSQLEWALPDSETEDFTGMGSGCVRTDRDKFRLLLELTGRVVSHSDLRGLMLVAASTIRRIADCDAVVVHLPDVQQGFLRPFVLEFTRPDGNTEAIRHLEERSSEETVCGIFRTRKHVANYESWSDLLPKQSSGLRRWGCAAPLVSQNRTFGVLELVRFADRRFTEEEVDFALQLSSLVAMATANGIAYAENRELRNEMAREKLCIEDEIRCEHGFDGIIGRSASIRSVLRMIETVAETDSSVLIYGETGTGKELIARAIHERSGRRANCFVKLNCAAIPTGLLESELFGHERGAFTGAIMQRIGRFELANRGTAFLDEIGEIPLELQPKLLRVLQEREFERLGSTHTLKTDARLIAATNRDLAACVESQTFRADLFYRLNVFPIHTPPLRERPEDIPMLVRHFVTLYARRMNRKIEAISSETMDVLVRYIWPGNIRELQNLIEHSVILSPGPTLHVPLASLRQSSAPQSIPGRWRTLEEAEREHILATLKQTRWRISGPRGAAEQLGLNRSTLQFRMRKLGIVRPGA